MRLLLGMIVGAALTVGGAWIIDRQNIGSLEGPFVNWERVERGWTNLREGTREKVRRITG
jgi:hypothetical protein